MTFRFISLSANGIRVRGRLTAGMDDVCRGLDLPCLVYHIRMHYGLSLTHSFLPHELTHFERL